MSEPYLLIRTGKANLQRKKYSEAIAEFTRVIEIVNSLFTQSKKTANWCIKCADQIKSYLLVSKTQSISDFSQLWFDLGDLFEKLKQVKKAKQCEKIALKIFDAFVIASKK